MAPGQLLLQRAPLSCVHTRYLPVCTPELKNIYAHLYIRHFMLQRGETHNTTNLWWIKCFNQCCLLLMHKFQLYFVKEFILSMILPVFWDINIGSPLSLMLQPVRLPNESMSLTKKFCISSVSKVHGEASLQATSKVLWIGLKF